MQRHYTSLFPATQIKLMKRLQKKLDLCADTVSLTQNSESATYITRNRIPNIFQRSHTRYHTEHETMNSYSRGRQLQVMKCERKKNIWL